MKMEITDYYNDFKEYYKVNPLRRFLIGLIVGILFGSSVYVISIFLRILSEDIFWNSILNDLPGIGGILGLAITLQMWGLLPQPMSNENKQISNTSTENNENSFDENQIDELENTKS
ncbi:MAG: hypothetical protein ACXACK_16585 [Candidatus Hodarchaeales archaeon]|jgi:hypothetical protein